MKLLPPKALHCRGVIAFRRVFFPTWKAPGNIFVHAHAHTYTRVGQGQSCNAKWENMRVKEGVFKWIEETTANEEMHQGGDG